MVSLDVLQILDDHSAKIKPPTIARTVMKPTLSTTKLPLADGVVELELAFLAFAWIEIESDRIY